MNNAPVIALTAALVMASAGAEAFDESKYPDLKGQWERVGVPNWTPAGKPPLTPEYEAVYEANRASCCLSKKGGSAAASIERRAYSYPSRIRREACSRGPRHLGLKPVSADIRTTGADHAGPQG